MEPEECEYCGGDSQLIAVVNDSEVYLCGHCMAVIRRHVVEA